MIDDYFDTEFTVYKKLDDKDAGRKVTNWKMNSTGNFGAFFTPGMTKTVRFGKQDVIIQRNLYCSADLDVEEGDRVSDGYKTYDVVYKSNTANKYNHLFIGLVSI